MGELYGSQSYIEHFRSGGAEGVVQRVLLNQESRRRKATKIGAVLVDYFRTELSSKRCLDVGCSGGHITTELGRMFDTVVGIDTDRPALELARSLPETNGVVFQRSSATSLPFKTASFDVVVCNHVYEHIDDQEALFAEIFRVLRPGGVCYFSGGNRFVLVETHYRLPLLSWPPKVISNLYLRLAGRGSHYLENHHGYWALRRMVSCFVRHDYTPRILAQPATFAPDDATYRRLPTRWMPAAAIRLLAPLFPTYIWVLEKPGSPV